MSPSRDPSKFRRSGWEVVSEGLGKERDRGREEGGRADLEMNIWVAHWRYEFYYGRGEGVGWGYRYVKSPETS